MKQLFSKDNRSDLVVGAIILVCLFLSTNALPGYMPSSVVMLAVALFVAAFGLFAVLIWHESPRDEREAHIMLSSDRLGFLVGAIALAIILVSESLQHKPTMLVAVALSSMVLAKLIGKYIHK